MPQGLAVKPNHLSRIPSPYMVEGELTSACLLWHMPMREHICMLEKVGILKSILSRLSIAGL